MVLFNHATREMTAKIVYYGPGLCGKTTNLMVIFDKLDPKQKGKMLSLATKTDRTLFFDLLPVDIGKVAGFNLKIQLYTVPGQVFYNETRKLVLRGADAIVFVADSQQSMTDSNRESFTNLIDNLRENQIDPDDTPILIQYNKRDLPGVPSVDELEKLLDLAAFPRTEASAIRGDGVMETFKLISKMAAKHLVNRLKGKTEPLDRKKAAVAAMKQKGKTAQAEPEPFAAAAADAAPLPDSMPFPEADENPVGAGYEKMEEVSLEQLLLEGRGRPATFSGTTPVPPLPDDGEEIEDIGTDALVIEDDAPLVAASDDLASPVFGGRNGSGDVAALEAEVRKLQQKLDIIRDEHRRELESILRELGDLTSRLRAQLD